MVTTSASLTAIDGDDQRFINRIFSYDYEEEALSKIRPNTVL